MVALAVGEVPDVPSEPPAIVPSTAGRGSISRLPSEVAAVEAFEPFGKTRFLDSIFYFFFKHDAKHLTLPF